MAFINFVIKTWVAAKHKTCWRVFACPCVASFFPRSIRGEKYIWTSDDEKSCNVTDCKSQGQMMMMMMMMMMMSPRFGCRVCGVFIPELDETIAMGTRRVPRSSLLVEIG